MRFLIGSYTADAGGAAAGIGVLRAGDPDGPLAGGQLSVGADAVSTGGSPSWLAWHPQLDVLYAALEGEGAVQAFRRTGTEAFTAVGAPVAVGDAVCHVAVEPGGRWLVASCWGDGQVVRVELDADGVPGAVAAAPAADTSGDAALDGRSSEEAALLGLAFTPPVAASGAVREDRRSRAHQARFVGTRSMVTTDLGLDRVRVWHTDGAALREVDAIELPRGCGPRHTVWHPSGHLYVVTELSLELFVIAPPRAGAGWRLVGGTPLSPGAAVGADAAAKIALSRDAQTVYAALRGSDTIAALRVRGDGREVTPTALVESGVAWPRHHTVVSDTLLVAGERSHEVVSLGLDERTGVPGRVRHRVATPSPSHLLPDPRPRG